MLIYEVASHISEYTRRDVKGMSKKNKLVISVLLVICLIGINFFIFRKTAANVQNKKIKEKSVKRFAPNYKLEIKTIKNGTEGDMYIPPMDELWIVYSNGTKEKLISPVPFGNSNNIENPVTDIINLTTSIDKKKIFFNSQLGMDCLTVYVYDLPTRTINSIAFGTLYGVVPDGEYKGSLKIYKRFLEGDVFEWKYVLLNADGKQIGTWKPDKNQID